MNSSATHRVILINRFFAPDTSATSQLATDLAKSLAREGCQLIVIASRSATSQTRSLIPSTEEIEGLRVIRTCGTSIGKLSAVGRVFDYATFYLSASWRLFRTAMRGDVILAMTDPPLIGVAAALVARFRRAALVTWNQDLFPEVAVQLGLLRSGALVRLLTASRNWSARSAVENVVIGGGMRAHLPLNAAAVQPRVIPNWALVEGGVDASELRSKWGLSGKFVILYAGNMGRVHSLDVIVEAAVALRHFKHIAFVFVGGGVQEQTLKQRAHDLALDNVQFHPPQPLSALREMLSLPDVHIASLDPRIEGIVVPSKVVGIVAVGKPIIWIGSTSGEIGRLVVESGCGVCVSAGHDEELASAVLAMSQNEAFVAEMGRNSLKLWAEEFKRESAHAKWLDVVRRARNALPAVNP